MSTPATERPAAHPVETFRLSETWLAPRSARLVPDGVPGSVLDGTAPVAAGPGRTTVLFDFGRETVGSVCVTVSGDAAAEVTFHYGEDAAEALSDDPCDVG